MWSLKDMNRILTLLSFPGIVLLDSYGNGYSSFLKRIVPRGKLGMCSNAVMEHIVRRGSLYSFGRDYNHLNIAPPENIPNKTCTNMRTRYP